MMQKDRKTSDKIQKRAYQIWEAEGRPDGYDLAHWRQAEREMAPAKPVRAARGSRPGTGNGASRKRATTSPAP